jgi:preprotein translocase subunit YajC
MIYFILIAFFVLFMLTKSKRERISRAKNLIEDMGKTPENEGQE